MPIRNVFVIASGPRDEPDPPAPLDPLDLPDPSAPLDPPDPLDLPAPPDPPALVGANRSATSAAASAPAPSGVRSTNPTEGFDGGVTPTTIPCPATPAARVVPASASASTPRADNTVAVPKLAAPRNPSRTTARVDGFHGSRLGSSAILATASTRARGETWMPSMPSAAAVTGTLRSVNGSPSPARTRSSAGRGRRSPTVRKNTWQEWASASAAVSGRLRSGWTHVNRYPARFDPEGTRPGAFAKGVAVPRMTTSRVHWIVVCSSITPDSSAAASVAISIIEPGATGWSS